MAVLRGDPSDGLPGVPGIGEKTGAALVHRGEGVSPGPDRVVLPGESYRVTRPSAPSRSLRTSKLTTSV